MNEDDTDEPWSISGAWLKMYKHFGLKTRREGITLEAKMSLEE
jgi:hypothetical protein